MSVPNGVHAADIFVENSGLSDRQMVASSYSGWYLRGDIGYTAKSNSGGDWSFWNQYAPPYRGVDDTFNYDNISLKGGVSYAVGVGYRINEMLRSDLSLDYLRAGINGRTACPSYIKSSKGFNPVEDNCHYEDNSSANIWTAMANAYVDLPKINKAITPYLGAGIGAAYVKYDTWNTAEICNGCTYTSEKPGLDSWRFAMGLMAGLSYDLNDQFKLDLGYRYLRVNGGNAYGYDAADRSSVPFNDGVTGPGASGAQAKDNGFNLHTVRVGLRYEIQ
ncbi:outer membrane beta-barrel protein [Brucella thiophenivorans]|nr:outer membrane protein [Brucella thiophenivorans]